MSNDIAGARLREIEDGLSFGADIPLAGIAIGDVEIEARFNGGAWATVATNANGSWSGTLTGQSNGVGRLEIRVAGVVQDWVEDIEVGTLFVTQSSSLLWMATAPHTWLGRPYIIDRGDGVWVVVYRSALGHGDEPTAKINMRFSDDEGATWSDENENLASGAISGMPIMRHNSGATDNLGNVTMCIAPNGDLLMFAEENPSGIYIYRSSDLGLSWTDEGKLLNDNTLVGGDAPCVIGSVIYLPLRYRVTPNSHPDIFRIYESADNGETWAQTGNNIDSKDVNEPSLANPSGTKAIAVVRGEPNEATPTLYITSDITVTTPTWTSNTTIGRLLNPFHRPFFFQTSHGLILVGREYLEQESPNERGVLYLWDNTNNRFHKKSYFGNIETDGFYCAIMERTDGSLYLMTYLGDTIDADMYQFVIELA